MIGRKVTSLWHGVSGVVVSWDPLMSGHCDATVQRGDGSLIAIPSRDLHPTDGRGPLPSRSEAMSRARVETLESLRAIRAALVRDWNEPWEGCEHGKAIVGMSLDNAIGELEAVKA